RAGAAAAHPQDNAAEGDHPQPACREFAVEAADLAQVEMAVEHADPGAYREGAAVAVDLEGAEDFPGVGVDEDAGTDAFFQPVDLEEDSGAVFGAADTDRVEGAFRVGFLGCFDLQAERNPMPLLFNAQLVSVEPLFELRGVGVEKPGDRCDRDE